MSIIRLFRLGIRVVAWATPHIKEWHQAKHLNRTEGQRHLQARNFAEAEKHLTLALDEKHSQKHRAEMLAQLAKAQTKQNKLTEAEASARAALNLASDPASQWEAVDSLVGIHLAQRNPAEAIRALESMEATEKARPKPDLQRLAQSQRQRGRLLLEAGRSTEGLTVLDASVKLAERAWGPGDLETAHSLAEVGAVHTQMEHHKEAQDYLGRALKIYRATSGFDSEEASRSLQNLAMSLEASGEYDRAAAEYERFVSASERQVGASAESVAGAKVRLSALYVQAGRDGAARELLTSVIGAMDRSPCQPLWDALQIMAVIEDQAGRPHEAARWRERADRLNLASHT